ncbi:MAG TPA: ABC transporter permease subunit [Gemmatimonadales bacterium]|nr:ABC transporter permease subunit [Gemmatimonadales bacterium]
MQLRTTFPSREALRRLPFGWADLAVILGTLTIVALVARIGAEAAGPFAPPAATPTVSLDPAALPEYAARSTLRMFVALGCSVVFTLVYGTIAAHSRRAERVLVPLLDVLQSVPVLGFLSVTITGFIALFPGSLLGLEAASVFAIFTSQVWNMTFSFYQSLRTIPTDLLEAARLYRLSRWERWTRLEVPAAMIGLVWNAMMSFGGGWFFVAASEAISVLNRSYTLPGIGSYVAAAVAERDLHALGAAILTMAIVILLVDQLFWRPLVAWADRFRLELSTAEIVPQSWLLDVLQRAKLPRQVGRLLPSGAIDRGLARLTRVRDGRQDRSPSRGLDRAYNAALLLALGVLLALGARFVLSEVTPAEVGRAGLLGLATFGRTIALLIAATLVWTPVGVAIGFNPRLARIAQPVVQLLASFPANFLFPFATVAFIWLGVTLDWGGILLMSLGAQWYILFNVIAGAMSIPTDLREMATSLGLTRWARWRTLIIPGIFSAWVTGGITAMGGAWNASIVSEIVRWGPTTLRATGLGAYIAEVTAAGDWPRIALGVGMMSLYVVTLNRLVWRRLYELAETRYRLA